MKKCIAELYPDYDGSSEKIQVFEETYIEDGERQKRFFVETYDYLGEKHYMSTYDGMLIRFAEDILKKCKKKK